MKEIVTIVGGNFPSRDDFEAHCARLSGHDEPWWQDHPTGLSVHDQHIRLYWPGLDEPAFKVWFYEVDTPSKLLEKVAWLIERQWPETTLERVHNFMHCVAQSCCWDYGFELPLPDPLPPRVLANRRTTDAQERAKLTPTLRYQILERDNRTCQCCGASVATGAVLRSRLAVMPCTTSAARR